MGIIDMTTVKKVTGLLIIIMEYCNDNDNKHNYKNDDNDSTNNNHSSR